ncbi:MAG: hypothetical protein AUH36_01940 [Chloroflexi bacterium 13_1_40CM_55_7]|nr:MAG: hypothetical protein AUH36_01940 [Chloroflexi bacterium 13_1_40CM_55_7]
MGSSQTKSEAFEPRRGLRGGHKQTLASFFLSRRIVLSPPEERLIEVEPGVTVLCQCHWQKDRQTPLTLVVVHGLEGSSESAYMLGMAKKGLAAGMNVVRMNQRNCGGTEGVAPTLYHFGLSRDVAAVAQYLIDQDPISKFGPSQFRAVAAVCPAMDLAASSDALHNRSNRLYEYYFIWKLRRRLRSKARLFPKVFETSRLRGVTTLRKFDDKITAHYCGFTGAVDYYSRAAAANVVDRIAVPAFILHAANDPFIRILPETRKKILANPNITFLETEDGGHCSFLAQPDGDDGRWAESQIVEFLRKY